jgi:hypothetical protein
MKTIILSALLDPLNRINLNLNNVKEAAKLLRCLANKNPFC